MKIDKTAVLKDSSGLGSLVFDSCFSESFFGSGKPIAVNYLKIGIATKTLP